MGIQIQESQQTENRMNPLKNQNEIHYNQIIKKNQRQRKNLESNLKK